MSLAYEFSDRDFERTLYTLQIYPTPYKCTLHLTNVPPIAFLPRKLPRQLHRLINQSHCNFPVRQNLLDFSKKIRSQFGKSLRARNNCWQFVNREHLIFACVTPSSSLFPPGHPSWTPRAPQNFKASQMTEDELKLELALLLYKQEKMVLQDFSCKKRKLTFQKLYGDWLSG